MASKVTTAFLYSLSIISILGFLAIILDVTIGENFLSKNVSSFILIVLGIGLVFESQIRKWASFRRRGIDSEEIVHITSGVVGIIAFISGLITIFGVTSELLNGIKLVISAIAIIVIAIQTFFVK